jgi:hypothetical protein
MRQPASCMGNLHPAWATLTSESKLFTLFPDDLIWDPRLQVIHYPLPDAEARRLIMQRFAKQLSNEELEVRNVARRREVEKRSVKEMPFVNPSRTPALASFVPPPGSKLSLQIRQAL